MKSKQLKQYLNKDVTFRDIWNNFRTAKMIEIDRYFITFEEKDGTKFNIKSFNIAQIQLAE